MLVDKFIVVLPGEGQFLNPGGSLVCKVKSDEVAGAYTVLELILTPQTGAPLHVHRREDEILYILEGECTVGDREQEHRLAAGASVVLPKGAAHFFRNDGETNNKILITAIPGGLDKYFEEINIAAASGQAEAVAAVNRKYDIEFFLPDGG